MSDELERIQKLENNELVLKEKVNNLGFIVESLWSLLQETSQLDDAELLLKFNELKQNKDLKKQENCRQCGRVLQKKLSKCIYCQVDVPIDPFNLIHS